MAPKEIHPDMDPAKPPTVLSNKETKRAAPEKPQKRALPSANEGAANERKPWVSSLSEQQRNEITRLLTTPNGPSYRAIARETGTTLAAVNNIATKTNPDPSRRLRVYGRRTSKRLPIKERVEVYRSVVLGEIADVRPADRLRALERIEALEGIVTAREQRESESNQVTVTPMFVLAPNSLPSTDAVKVEARRIQDES